MKDKKLKNKVNERKNNLLLKYSIKILLKWK